MMPAATVAVVDGLYLELSFPVETNKYIRGYTTEKVMFRSDMDVYSMSNVFVSLIAGDVATAKLITTDGCAFYHILTFMRIADKKSSPLVALPDRPEIGEWLASRPYGYPGYPLRELKTSIPKLLALGKPNIAIAMSKFYVPLQEDLITYQEDHFVSSEKVFNSALITYAEHMLDRKQRPFKGLFPDDVIDIINGYESDFDAVGYKNIIRKLRPYLTQLEHKAMINNLLSTTPAACNALFDTVRTVNDFRPSNILKAALSASIYMGFNSVVKVAYIANVATHIAKGEYFNLPKDLVAIGSMAIPAFAVYQGIPYVGTVFVYSMASLAFINAGHNAWSLAREFGLDNTSKELKAAEEWRDWMKPISEWKLPIISDIASSIKISSEQKIYDINIKLILSAAELHIKAQLVNASRPQINHVNIPSKAQEYKCLELELNTELAYYCYNPEEERVEWLTGGNDVCNSIEDF